MKKIALVFCLIFFASPAFAQLVENPTAEFAGLDKITGRIIKFDVQTNETVQFGALQVTPRACHTRAESDAPLTTGFIEVDEITLKNEIHRLFNGWMFADSPGLNAVEHPIYDIWLTDCKGGKVPTQRQNQTPGYEGAEPQATDNPRPAKPPAPPRPKKPAPEFGEPFDPDEIER